MFGVFSISIIVKYITTFNAFNELQSFLCSSKDPDIEEYIFEKLIHYNLKLRGFKNNILARNILNEFSPLISNCFSDEYINSPVICNIHPELRLITIYCMSHCHPELRFKVFYKCKDYSDLITK